MRHICRQAILSCIEGCGRLLKKLYKVEDNQKSRPSKDSAEYQQGLSDGVSANGEVLSEELRDSIAATYGVDSFIPGDRKEQNRAVFSVGQVQFFVCVALLSVAICVSKNVSTFIIIFINIGNVIFFYLLIFKFGFIFYGARIQKSLTTPPEPNNKQPITYPVYSILLPLYNEANILEMLIRNIDAINYPRDKLQVLLVVEVDDDATIKKASSLILPGYFQIVKVPKSFPRTKAKACNYALRYVYGKYVAVWDAEDKPSADQLHEVLEAFRSGGEDLVCVQARLSYYNAHENILAQMFTIEYSILFDYMLPAFSEHRLPIPLGGSSNHLKTAFLKGVGGWDSFNVTEDAEMGIRIAAMGKRVMVINNYTYEESPLNVRDWMKQRVRWLKGHLYTYLFYMRSPIDTFCKLGKAGFAAFNYALGISGIGLMLAPILIMLMIILQFKMLRCPEIFIELTWYFSMLNLILGIGILVYSASIVCERLSDQLFRRRSGGMWCKLILISLFPLYFILHSIAAFLALIELIKRPYYWHKTHHGISSICHLNMVPLTRGIEEK